MRARSSASIVRLDHEIVASRFNAGQPVAPFGPRRDNDNRNETGRGSALQLPADVETVAARRRSRSIRTRSGGSSAQAASAASRGLNHANLTSLFGTAAGSQSAR